MHFILTYKRTIGLLQNVEGIGKVCVLKCIFFLLFSCCKILIFGHILGMPLMARIWAMGNEPDQTGYLFSIRHSYRTPLNSAIIQESDQESGSEDSEDCEETKADKDLAFNAYLLGFDELRRTKSILAKCAATNHRRVKRPLFVLYHTWKDYPA